MFESWQSVEPPEIARLCGGIADKSRRLMWRWLQRPMDEKAPAWHDDLGVARAFFDAWMKVLADPQWLAAVQAQAWLDYGLLWQRATLRMLGHNAPPVAEPQAGDRRFRADAWQSGLVFDFIKQSYLVASRHLHRALAGCDGLDEPTARKVDFYTRQYIDALAPTNFVLTNPEVLRETVATGGRNLLRGVDHLLDDLLRGDGEVLRVRMTDHTAFALGVNVAVTPGSVIYQNELMQLIQYAPATPTVHRSPLLIVPPWINKYYILDLRPENSFVRWAVEQGHTVFVISWVNPDARHAEKTFADYVNEGLLAALRAVEQATGERRCSALGFCLGGTLLAVTLGHLAATGDERIASATFFASLIDFHEPGELGVFIDEEQVAALEARMQTRGYLDGRDMATTFSLLRANDLVWSFVINNYLLGREPPGFDLLYWNADSTRMPAAMHGYYLRNMYLRNRLAQRGGLVVNGTPIDLKRVQTPTCFVSTAEDHIAPWRSTYAGAQCFGRTPRFVLGGSGHIAGIVNPPAANKYGYWTNEALPPDPGAWLHAATRHEGSWWFDWNAWAARHAGDRVPARVPGAGALPVIEPAPGRYVKRRFDDS